MWEFTSYYDMSELLNDCGGTIGTDGQVSFSSFELLVIAYPLIPILKKREDTPYSVLKFLPLDFESLSVIYRSVNYHLSYLV